MNTLRKVITSFGTIEDAKLYVRGEVVIQKLTGNPTFPGIPSLPPLTQPASPAPAVPNLTDANSDFLAALVNADSGDTLTTSAKNDARALISGMLNSWADYINLIAKGNLTQLLTSGFIMNKLRQKAAALPKPDAPVVSSPQAGQLLAAVNAVTGAFAYLWKVQQVDATTGAPIGIALLYPTTPAHLMLTGRPNTTRWEVSVLAIGTNDEEENWSDIIPVTIG